MVNTRELKKRMLDYGLTTAKLAEKVGVTQGYMSAMITGSRPLTLKNANLIQEALEIPNEEFGFYFLDGAR